MIVRVSPGSPSQWNATLSPRPASTWRSRQFSGDVERAADEPLREGQLPLEDRVPLVIPVEEVGGLPGPEPLEVLVGLVVEEGPGDERLLLELVARREGPVLGQVVLDLRRGSIIGHAATSMGRALGRALPVSLRSAARVRRASGAAGSSGAATPGPVKAPRPVGSRRASASLTRLRARSASRSATWARSDQTPAALVHQLVDAVRGQPVGLTDLAGRRRAPGQLVDAHLAGDVLLAEALEHGGRRGRGRRRSAASRPTGGRPGRRCAPRSRSTTTRPPGAARCERAAQPAAGLVLHRDAGAGRRVGGQRADRPQLVVLGRHQHLGEAHLLAVDPDPHLLPASLAAVEDRKARLSSSSLARTTTGRSSAGSSPRLTTTGPTPTWLGRSMPSASTRDGPSPNDGGVSSRERPCSTRSAADRSTST